MRQIITGIVALLCALPLLAPDAPALENRHFEDFTTTVFRDPMNTNAIWDTGLGQLRTPPFVLYPSSLETPGNAWSVATSGLRAYVADGSSLLVVDISEPSSPWEMGRLDLPPGVCSVAVSGRYAFVANSAAGLQVVDVSNPFGPWLVTTVPVSGVARGIFVAGRRAYVAAEAAGLQIFDVSVPPNPIVQGGYDTPGSAWAVQVDGHLAYVADRSGGLQILNVMDPYYPYFNGGYSGGGDVIGVFVDGRRAYVADAARGLLVLDVAGPYPSLLGLLDTPDLPLGVCAAGDRVFLADGTSFLVVDVADPTNPTIAMSWQTPGIVQGVCLWGEHALVADGTAGIHLLPIAGRVPPALAGRFVGINTTLGVGMYGNLAVLANYSGPMVFDVSAPASPAFVAYRPLEGTSSVALAGRYALVGTMAGEIHVFDVGGPDPLFQVHQLSVPPSPIVAIRVRGDRAYAIGDGGQLFILDVSIPSLPSLLHALPIPGALDVAATAEYAYVATPSAVQVVAVDGPAPPAIVATIGVPATSLALAGDLALAADGSRLSVLHLESQAVLGTVPTQPGGRIDAIHGSRAFVGGSEGLQAFDFARPAAPFAAGDLPLPGGVLDVSLAGEFAFLATADGAFNVARIAQHVADGSRGRGQSYDVKRNPHAVSRARLSATQTEGVSWQLSTDGWNWREATPGASWTLLPRQPWLMWRATLSGGSVMPTVYDLQVEWLYDFPLVTRVRDVPRDQGRQARVEWLRSDHDFPGDAQQIVEYAIYRRIDPGLGKRAVDPAQAVGLSEAARLHAAAMAEEGWDFLLTVPVRVQDRYSVVAPTLEDSTAAGPYWSVFMVSALTATPGVFFDSPPDSGQSADNLAPSVPTGFVVARGWGGAGDALSWEESPDADFGHFRIYRGTSPDFVPAAVHLVHLTIGTGWVDPQAGDFHYKVAAVDFAGNESGAASPQAITGVGGADVPRSFALLPSAPNPFNPSTVIRFDVPAGGGELALRVYDLAGRLVRTLVEGPQDPGRRAVSWDGRDGRGQAVPSGTYLCRLTAGGVNLTQKMTLAK